MRRYAKNRDKSERGIIEALEKAGAKVLPLNFDTREGVPDLLVYFRGRLTLLECKNPLGPKGGSSQDGQQLSKAQIKFHEKWAGVCDTARSPLEALQAINAITPEEIQCPTNSPTPEALKPRQPDVFAQSSTTPTVRAAMAMESAMAGGSPAGAQSTARMKTELLSSKLSVDRIECC